jgi:acyl carrier protein
MELEKFIGDFAACFNSSPVEGFRADTQFKKNEEWGSMMALIVIAMVDSDYERTITAEDIKQASTIQDLFETIKNK